MPPHSAPMDYFQPDASFYWDAYVSPSQTPARNVTTSVSITTTTTQTIFEDGNGYEYYVSTPPYPSPSHEAPSTPSWLASRISWQPEAQVRRSTRGPYGQYNQHFIEAERRDLELNRRRCRRIQAPRKTSAEKVYKKVNDIVDKAVKQPWKKMMGKIRRKSQPEAGDRRESYVVEDSSSTSDVHIEYADDLRLRGGKGRA